MTNDHSITRLLERWQAGDEDAFAALAPMVYQTLRCLAAKHLRRESPGHTWQPTDLVHEAFLQIADADVDWTSRAHFFAVAARQMRRLLIDHARGKQRAKRGGDQIRVTFIEDSTPAARADLDLLDLDRALEALAQQDSRKARIIELHVFAGLGYEEMAQLLEVSAATVKRDLRFARAWLTRELNGKREDAPE
ncbi:MAG: sigma-70 family RNA polymerase sigma factor [Gammaproteobacteria bacterium]|nr:MAG: sigma-70 family RNA polymerase sigma factor [Gammaproteobacteria bacterium]